MKKPNVLFLLFFLLSSGALLAQNTNPYPYVPNNNAYVSVDLASPLAKETDITITAATTLSISFMDSSHSSSSLNVPYLKLEEPKNNMEHFLRLRSFSSSNSWVDTTFLTPTSSFLYTYITNSYNCTCTFVPISVGVEDLVFSFGDSLINRQTLKIQVTVTP